MHYMWRLEANLGVHAGETPLAWGGNLTTKNVQIANPHVA